MNLSNTSVLVTGADGFIGSHVVEHLVRAGADVTAFVYYNSLGSWGWLDHCASDVAGRFKVIAGDVRDAQAVSTAVEGNEVVLHLAALIAIPYSYAAPYSYVDTNVSGTLNVVRAAREHDVRRVVCTSTSEVYGTAQFVPITEDHPVVGQSPYSASKIGADQIAMSYYYSFDTPVALIRPFNTYGPRQSERAVIPTIIAQIAAGREKIKLGKLSPTRDFSFVHDTARAFLAMTTGDGVVGETVNFGSGFEISVEDTAHLIADIMGREVEFVSDIERVRPEKSEVDRLYAGIEKAGRLLDWAPEYGGRDGFRRGLERTIEWFSDPRNIAFYKGNEYTV